MMQYSKIFTVLSLSCLFMYKAHSQSTAESPWSASVSAGVALPLGEFASKNINDEKSGYGKPGADVHVQLNYQFSDYFGAAALLGMRVNSYDVSELNSSPTAASNFSISSYKAGRLLVGPTFTLPLRSGGKWNLTARMLFGVQQLFPETIDETSTGVSTSEKLSFSLAFAYQPGVGLQYVLNSKCYLSLGGDFLGATYKTSKIKDGTGTQTVSGGNKGPFNSTNIDLGIGFRF